MFNQPQKWDGPCLLCVRDRLERDVERLMENRSTLETSAPHEFEHDPTPGSYACKRCGEPADHLRHHSQVKTSLTPAARYHTNCATCSCPEPQE